MSDRVELDRLKRHARIDRVVSHFLNEAGRKVTAAQIGFHCPFHDDQHESLHVHPDKDGGVYVCRVCGAKGDVFTFVGERLGLGFGDSVKWVKTHIGDLPGPKSTTVLERVAPGKRQPPDATTSAAPVTLEELANAKGIPVSVLEGFGLCNMAGKGVWVPYALLDGRSAPRQRLRFGLRAKDGSKWNAADGEIVPYINQAKLIAWRGKGSYLVVCEGESDSWTLWHADIPAIGLPGAQTAKTLQAEYLDGFSVFIVTREPDNGGTAFAQTVPERIRTLVPNATVCVLSMPEGCGDVNDWYRRNPETFRAEFDAAVMKAIEAPDRQQDPTNPAPKALSAKSDEYPTTKLAAILDDAPLEITRPLSIVQGHAYAATWVFLSNDREKEHLLVVRNDGVAFCGAAFQGGRLLAELDLVVRLPHVVHRRFRWSGRGANAYLAGKRADPLKVFQALTRIVNHHVCFVRSLGEQDVMAELLAAYVLSTWFLESFDVAGYLWFAGERGSGKTWALKTVAQLGFLGTQLLAGSSLPALRDISDYGGLIGLDDAENVTDPDKFDDDKRALFLSGNQRGGFIAVKEPSPGGKKGWTTRYVNIFSPRVFSAIRSPDATLASRCIQVPMCRASANLPDPMNEDQWPIKRADLVDNLWALALEHMPRLRALDAEVVKHTELVGRTLQPWRGVLTMALWLERDHGATGLLARMTTLSKSYQNEREELEKDDPVRVAISCLGDMLEDQTSSSNAVVFKTSELTERMNKAGQELDLAEPGKDFTNARRAGRMLSRLRFPRPENLPGPRRWKISPSFYRTLVQDHGVNGHNLPSSNTTAIVHVQVNDDDSESF
jgi:hypothetical protein